MKSRANGTGPKFQRGQIVAIPGAGDKIQEVHHHIDMMTMMTQLGAIPS